MTLNLTVAPTAGERGTHRVQVSPQACCKAAQLGDNAVVCTIEPLIKSGEIAPVNQAKKMAAQTAANGN